MTDYDFNPLRMEMMIKEIVSSHYQFKWPLGLTRDTLHKLCYLVDSTFYQKYEISMTGESYVHTSKGPVPIHFDDSLDELITDDRVSVNDNGIITPCETAELSENSMRECLTPPTTMDESEFGHLAYHVLPMPTPYEREVISEITSRYSRTDPKMLEVVVKSDPAWKLSSEGQLMDYEYVFYREDEQEAPDDEE